MTIEEIRTLAGGDIDRMLFIDQMILELGPTQALELLNQAKQEGKEVKAEPIPDQIDGTRYFIA